MLLHPKGEKVLYTSYTHKQDQYLQSSVKVKVNDSQTDRLQPLAEQRVKDHPEASPASEMPKHAAESEMVSQLDADVAEFKYQNLRRLMATPVDTLDDYQLELVVQQIINALPEMVAMGQMHPFDATLAHVQAIAKQDREIQASEFETIKQNYMNSYPFPINSNRVDLH
jgi:hypothetical protein